MATDFLAALLGQDPPAITALSVRDFKSLAKGTHRIELRPLTLLAGANSSGKSSALQPLLLLKQTLEASYDPGPLLLDGSHVRLTSPDEILPRLPRRSAASFAFGVSLSGGVSVETTFHRVTRNELSIQETCFVATTGTSISLRPDLPHEEIVSFLPPRMVEDVLSSGAMLAALGFDSLRGEGLRVFRHRSFLTLKIAPRSLAPPLWIDPTYVGHFEVQIKDLLHVPGLRGNPERAYRKTAVGPQYPGTFEQYVAAVVHHWQTAAKNKVEQVNRALAHLGLTWGVAAEELDATSIALKVGRLPTSRRRGSKDLVNVADVGFGVSQVLPVVVALTLAEPGRLVYLEQPEIHLHPKAQVALAEILVEAANRGVRVVAETHSALLLLTIQSLIVEGRIDPGNVALHWFEREADGSTQITTAEPDENGAYGDWPEDFGRVILDAESRYLDAVGARVRS